MRPLASALKTFALLDLLGRNTRPVRLAALAREAEDARATVYQRLVTLMAAGWAEQTADGAFRLTLRAAGIAKAAAEQAGLGLRTLPVLEALCAETGETASLAILEGSEPCIVQRVEARGILRVEMRVGATMSLTGSASGRVLLAFATPATRARLAPEVDGAMLDAVREAGHAISSGHSIEGIRAAAVPVLDGAGSCMAALSLVAPAGRFPEHGWADPLRASAARLRAMMEGRSA